MTRVAEALHALQQRLCHHGITDARLEADLLLMASLETDRATLYARLTGTLPPLACDVLAPLVERRLRREPLAYVLGQREFYGLSFHVAPGALIPRPETELLVEEALAVATKSFGGRRSTIVDVGTGSGAIAIALAVHLPQARIIATDISVQALRIADVNRRKHGVADRVHLLRADLLEPVQGPVDMVVSNPPYVASVELTTLEPEIRIYEPPEALDGGPDGLEVVRRLLPQAAERLGSGGALVMELDPRHVPQAKALSGAAFRASPLRRSGVIHIRVARDLAGRERALVVEVMVS